MAHAEVFLSYKRAPDRTALVRRLAHLLRNHGVSVWWDHGLESGLKFKGEIEDAIAHATIVVPLWCSQSVYSTWVLREARLGQEKLLPAKLQNVSPPGEFSEIHAADLTNWNGNVRSAKVAAFLLLVQRKIGRSAYISSDTLDELETLPDLLPLPQFDADADALLQRFRNGFLRQDPAFAIADAMRINLDSPLSDLLGDCTNADEYHQQLCEFCFEAADEELIQDSDHEWLVYPEDMEGMSTLGELIDHMVSARRS